jgi:hypothetical protein
MLVITKVLAAELVGYPLITFVKGSNRKSGVRS